MRRMSRRRLRARELARAGVDCVVCVAAGVCVEWQSVRVLNVAEGVSLNVSLNVACARAGGSAP